MLTSIGVAVYDWDLVSDRIAWGSNAADVLGVTDFTECSTGERLATMSEPDRTRALKDLVERSAPDRTGSGVPYQLTYTLQIRGDLQQTVAETGRWFADEAGRPISAHGLIRITQAAGPPAIDGASERSVFLENLAADITAAARANTQVSVVVAALQDVGELNEVYGFGAVDLALDEMGRRLRRALRRRDAFSRYTGNRFALAFRACPLDHLRFAIERVASVAAREPLRIGAHEIAPILLFGGATAPVHSTDAGALLRCAEQALSATARDEANTISLYDSTTARNRRRQGTLRRDGGVLDLLNERRVAIACQPVVDAKTRKTAFAEALLRVRDASGAVTTATSIIPVVERAGLIQLFDIRVLELATDHLSRHPDVKLSVNVSPASLEGTDWSAALKANIGRRSDLASRLIVEVTETVAVRDPEATRRRLDAIKSLGVSLAIDDFGAGHTSFRHLRSFPVDLIKMDGAFAQNLGASHDDCFFVRTLVDLAHHIGLPIVAEWVEDEATASLLSGWGVDLLQGYHCGRPLLADGGDASETGALRGAA